jgi:hypothetical protein
MDLGAIILLILVFVFMLFFVTRPFFIHQREDSVENTEKNRKLSFLLAEHERLLSAIQELDSDQVLDKIPAEDYSGQRGELLQMGADVLRQIDELTLHPENGEDDPAGMPSPTPVALSNDELEELLARRRTIRKDKTGGFCPKCGKPVLFSDSFCPTCGHALK